MSSILRHTLHAVTIALTAVAIDAAAHHSFTATYFEDRTIEIEGKLLQFMFRNPHTFVHVEAPDEASHEGDAAAKIKALEEIDRHIVGPVLAELRRRGDYRILVSPDHPTPLRTKTHSHGLVPFAICGSGIRPDAQRTYDEVAAVASGLKFDPGWRLMRYFIG